MSQIHAVPSDAPSINDTPVELDASVASTKSDEREKTGGRGLGGEEESKVC